MTVKPLEAENAVIGSILVDPRCLRDVRDLLRPEDFALAVNQAIYRTVLAMERKGVAIDPVTIRDEAAKAGVALSSEFLIELMDNTPTAAHAGEHARITREHSIRRSITALGDNAKERAADPTAEPSDTMAELRRGLEQLQQEGVTQDLLSPEDQVLRFHDHREKVEQGESTAFVPTGFRDLDDMLGGGLIASGLHILAARPGMGKTTLALNVAERVAKTAGPVLFVSLEMDDEQLTAKRQARLTGISATRLLMGRELSEEEYRKVADADEVILSTPLYLNARPTATVPHVEDLARKIRGLRMIVIDYFGKLLPENGRKWSGRVEYTTEICGDVKNLARKFKVPVLMLAQLNREPEKRSDPAPQLSDLRETGAAEQDADTVTFLYRDSDGHSQMKLEKNRHGRTGQIGVSFDFATSSVRTGGETQPAKRRRKEPEYKQQAFYNLPGSEKVPWEDEYDHVGEEPKK